MKTSALLLCILLIAASKLSSQEAPATAPAAQEVLKLLAAGKQDEAEAKIRETLSGNPKDLDCIFLYGLCQRSRFDPGSASAGFLVTLGQRPGTPEALASACVLGIDLAADRSTELYYYNALLIVGSQNPDSLPIRWLGAIMSRSLTREDNSQPRTVTHKRIVLAGVRDYQAVLALCAPGLGPSLVHQTLANLLDDAEAYETAWKHREIVTRMEPAPWSLHAAGMTLSRLHRDEEAVPLFKKAIQMQPDFPHYHDALADAYWDLGRTSEALEEWKQAAGIPSPWQSSYFDACSNACRSLGDYAAARDYAAKALAAKPDDRALRIKDARLAALVGEPGASERLLEAGTFDFNGKPVPSKPSTDPWFLAVETGDLATFRKLLGSAAVNERDPKDSRTPLMKAACAGWEPMVAELIQAGADLDLVDKNACTALHFSGQFGQPRCMKLLLEAGANPNL